MYQVRQEEVNKWIFRR